MITLLVVLFVLYVVTKFAMDFAVERFPQGDDRELSLWFFAWSILETLNALALIVGFMFLVLWVVSLLVVLV